MKPRATLAIVEAAARKMWTQTFSAVPFPEMLVVGVRGYYRDTMGKRGVNDRGIYDDGIFVIGENTLAAYNANTDPSAWRDGVASLLPGCHPYRPGNHGISRPGGGYPAFRPATNGEALPVSRDGEKGRSSRDGVAINIHKGGVNSTSSLGCQTIRPDQWEAFYSTTRLEMKRAGLVKFWYILIDGPIN